MALKKLLTILAVVLLSACEGYNKLAYEYPKALQPIYIGPVDNYNGALIVTELKQKLIGYDIDITDNIKSAKTLVNLSDVNKRTYKEVKNNLADNSSIFYKGSYNATISIKHPKIKNNIHQKITTITPIIELENQNIFSSADTEQIFNELKNDLINIILRKILFSNNKV
jgi:outer membrane lipopolysaccharide assembly protein LptE/RlpB